MKIVMIASEAVPFAKTGGLADIVGTLPVALAEAGEDVSIIIPFYGKKIDKKKFGIKLLSNVTAQVEVGKEKIKGEVLYCEMPSGIKVYFISQPTYFNRDELYQTTAGDYPDNAARFIFFARAAIELINALGTPPDIVHVHDWQAALVPVYLKSIYKDKKLFANARVLLTIHNLGYQGLFPKEEFPLTGLNWEYFTFDKLEFWGKVNFLKGGIAFADAINTVSKKYADEILTPEQGMGLDKALLARKGVLCGILNGIDYKDWSPETDVLIPANFTPKDMKGKEKCKAELRKHYKLPHDDTPVIGIVGRLTSQKGFDILSEALPKLMKREFQFAILGTGEAKYHDLLTRVRKQYPNHIGLELAFDNKLAHLIEAGSDMFLMASHYEPCGLNQMISLKYGTIPIVRATGGLDDSIEDFDVGTEKGNGFKFEDYTSDALVAAVDRALDAYKKPAVWKRLVANAMECNFSWTRSAKEYIALYRKMLGKKW
ncbi:MAG: glycogen synthase GlgA [Pseudomonadota bacterium]